MESGIRQLSTELFLEVVSHLEDDQQSLLSLCLTRKDISAIAQPFLYREYHNSTQSGHFRNSGKFLRTLLNRPELALEVRSLDFSLFESGRPLPLTSNDASMAVQKVSQSGLKISRRQLSAALQKGSSDAIQAAILVIAPNIRRLLLKFEMPDVRKSFVWKLFQKSLTMGTRLAFHGFSKLAYLFLSSGNSQATIQQGFGLNYIAPFLGLPAVDELIVWGSKNRVFDETMWCESIKAARNIRFMFCDLNDEILTPILFRCKSIESLELVTDGPWDFTMAGLFRALESQKDTLRDLTLDSRHFDDDDDDDDLEELQYGPISSFNQFSKLTHLSISGLFLTGSPEIMTNVPSLVDFLPPSLTHLAFIGHVVGWNEILAKFLGGFRDRLPNFSVLAVPFPTLIDDPLDLTVIDGLERAGIRLAFTTLDELTESELEFYEIGSLYEE